jgi:hypothetical protein
MKAAWSFGALGLIALALVVPGPRESAAPAGGRVISMGHEMFGRSVITIRVGDHLNFSNGSAWLHVLVPGRGARQDSQPGMPRLGPRDAHLSEHGDRYHGRLERARDLLHHVPTASRDAARGTSSASHVDSALRIVRERTQSCPSERVKGGVTCPSS